MSTTALSPLRQPMIEDMKLRNLAPRTQEAYIRGCKKLAAFLRRSPDTSTAEDIRLFQLHLAEQGVSICNGPSSGVAPAALRPIKALFDSQVQAIQLSAENAKLRSQISDKRLVSMRIVRLARADDHAIHFVDEALDDDAAVFLALYRGEVDREFAPQS